MHANVTTPRARCCRGSRLMFVHFGSDTVKQNVCMFIWLQVTKTTGILLESSVWWCLTNRFSCFAAQFSSIFAFCSAWHPPRVQVVLLRTSPLFQPAPNKTRKRSELNHARCVSKNCQVGASWWRVRGHTKLGGRRGAAWWEAWQTWGWGSQGICGRQPVEKGQKKGVPLWITCAEPQYTSRGCGLRG